MIDTNGMLVQGFILLTGVIGQLYVSHHNVKGFYYWAASNIALIVVALKVGGYGMVVLYVFFFIMAVYSILRWRKRQAEEKVKMQDHAELLKVARVFVELADTPGATKEIALHVYRAKVILMNQS